MKLFEIEISNQVFKVGAQSKDELVKLFDCLQNDDSDVWICESFTADIKLLDSPWQNLDGDQFKSLQYLVRELLNGIVVNLSADNDWTLCLKEHLEMHGKIFDIDFEDNLWYSGDSVRYIKEGS